jgi:flagellar assembly factor FliW
MKIATLRFGELDFEENVVYHFPDGLPGFEELHDFIMMNDNDSEPLKWLLSLVPVARIVCIDRCGKFSRRFRDACWNIGAR